MNNHPMKTRSQIKKDILKVNTSDDDSDDESIISNDEKLNINDIENDIDENGNIENLIDYNCNDDFNDNLLNKELNRLRNSPYKSIYKKPSSNINFNDNIVELILNTIAEKANEELENNHLDKKRKIDLKNISDSDEDSDEEWICDEEEYEEDEEEYEEDEECEDCEVGEEVKYSTSDDETYESFKNNIEENIVFNNENENLDEDTYVLDEYDSLYAKLIEKKNDDSDNDFEYFIKQDINSKKKIIEDINNINKINDLDIPLKFKILQSKMDINTKSTAINQINKIENMDVSSGEYSKMDQWISGLIKIPFSKYIKLPIDDNSDINDKKKFLKDTYNTLNKAIYGHEDAKSHILQVLGKWIKNPNSTGNILALQGPMGNGKTTLVKEGIAKAINRPFAFIALGGASDSSYFNGHNYTYEGSHWGRIIDILIKSKCMNPIIYFDELDKVSDTYKGQEIIHLLTHLTDHSQNDKYQDNYFSGIDIDLSKVLFIFSFNDENLIDPILKDRMYVIKTKGFDIEDKIQISNKYLLPQLLDIFKFNDKINFTENIIKYIIDNHTNNEKGVRNLKRCFETIISKVNMYEILYNNEKNDTDIKLPYVLKNFSIPYNIKEDDLKLLLTKDEIYKPPEHMYL
jgi:ATP-dependent Lon protease